MARRAQQYYDPIVAWTTEGLYKLEDALYESFYYIHRQPTWGEFPVSCGCLGCCKCTICEHTTLLTSLLRTDIAVLDNLVTPQEVQQGPLHGRPSQSLSPAGDCKAEEGFDI